MRPDSTTHLIRETCRAPHPDPARRHAEKCGTLLGYFPVPTETAELRIFDLTRSGPEKPPRSARVLVTRCSRRACHRWNWFEIREPER